MVLRVGRIPFLNCEPFFRHVVPGAGIEMIPASPKALADMARAGLIDAAALPLTECFALEGAFEPLGSLGIAVRGPVRSVLVFSDVPLGDLSGRTVSVCEETSCSAGLLRVLLGQRHGCSGVRFERSAEDEAGAAARLEIGDRALRVRAASRPLRFDLASEWLDWTGLPFVFARWVVRRDVPAGPRAALLGALEASLEASLADPEATASAGDRLGLRRADSRAYLDAFAYRLGADEGAGMERFRALLERLDVRS